MSDKDIITIDVSPLVSTLKSNQEFCLFQAKKIEKLQADYEKLKEENEELKKRLDFHICYGEKELMKVENQRDEVLREADALRETLRQAPLDTENDEHYTIYVEGRMRWYNFRAKLGKGI